MKRFYLFFYLFYWCSYIVYPEYFVCRGGGESFLFIFLKTKKNEKKHPRLESNPAFQSSREMLARFSRGFIHAAGIPIESRPWLAWASYISRPHRSPGEKALANLRRLQQSFTRVQLASNLRDNRTRMRKFKYSPAPRSGTCVPNLGPTYAEPLHSRSQRSKHR